MLALALVLLPGPALAKEESDVRAYIFVVNRLYEDLEFERALAQITRARSLVPTMDEDVTLSLYEGLILADMNRWEDATAAFKTALFLRPQAKLPVKVSPKVEQHFEKVRQEVKQELGARQKPPEASSQARSPQLDRPAEARRPEPVPTEARPGPRPESSVQVPVASDAMPGASTEVTRQGLRRPQILIPAITGGVLAVVGGTTWAMSRRELSRLKDDDPNLDTPEEVRSTSSRGSTFQTVGVGLLGVGLVGLGVAAGLYAFETPSDLGALKVGTDGTSAFVQGRWP